jgi:signal transduction histidine kinase
MVRVTPNGSSAALPEALVDPARTAQTVHEFREELRRLSGRLVSIQEDERRRIALDLHDGLGQSMSLIKLSLETAIAQLAQGGTDEAGQSLQNLVARVKDALNQVRRVSTELRPSILDDLGIMPTLSWHFREFEAVCGGVRVDKALHVAEEDIPVALHITLYRILQEALHNVVKHARADLVRVVLHRSDDTLHLQVEDNGCGFSPDRFSKADGRIRGFGLSGMKERVLYSGGSWQLRSSPGAGTSIAVAWPCPSVAK